jgi:hypothetical protein
MGFKREGRKEGRKEGRREGRKDEGRPEKRKESKRRWKDGSGGGIKNDGAKEECILLPIIPSIKVFSLNVKQV